MNKLLKVRPLLFVLPFVISVIGILTLVSSETTSSTSFSLTEITTKQVIFVVTGVLVFLSMSKFDASFLKYRPVMLGLYIITLILLGLTLLIGEQRNNATRWISIGGVQLQPSEIAKITVLVLTSYVVNIEKGLNKWLYIGISFLLLLPILALVYLQPHGSMTLILLVIWAFTVFISMKNQIRNLVVLILAGAMGVGMYLLLTGNQSTGLIILVSSIIFSVFMFFARDGWKLPIIIAAIGGLLMGSLGTYAWNNVLLPYQKERINVFINPDQDDQNASFNVNQAKIAIGSGKLWGKGWGNGTQGERNFLPEHQTDFIFATYAEEFGLAGGLLLVGLYCALILGIFLIPMRFNYESFLSVIVVSIGFKILLEMFINLGTNTGITPATGIPLPLMSAGGTITIMTFFSLGLIQSIINSQSVDI